jgi:hypothetical protein
MYRIYLLLRVKLFQCFYNCWEVMADNMHFDLVEPALRQGLEMINKYYNLLRPQIIQYTPDHITSPMTSGPIRIRPA